MLRLFKKYGVYRFSVIFTPEDWYKGGGINTLIGYGHPLHKRLLSKVKLIKALDNSYIIGWKPVEQEYGVITIYRSKVVQGIAFNRILGRIRVNETLDIELGIFKRCKWVMINREERVRDFMKTLRFGMMLTPSVTEKAPKRLEIKIESTWRAI